MAKMTKQELINKINEKEDISEDVKIELMEDITDSFEVVEDTEYKEKYEEIKRKYKERFLDSSKKEEEIKENFEEKKEIDIKEI